MTTTETHLHSGSRWKAYRCLTKALKQHADDRGQFKRIEFKRIAFRYWLVWVEFEHEEEEAE